MNNFKDPKRIPKIPSALKVYLQPILDIEIIVNELIAEPKRLPELKSEYIVALYLSGTYSLIKAKLQGFITDYKVPRINLIKKNI
jgi:hypothetical protein